MLFKIILAKSVVDNDECLFFMIILEDYVNDIQCMQNMSINNFLFR